MPAPWKEFVPAFSRSFLSLSRKIGALLGAILLPAAAPGVPPPPPRPAGQSPRSQADFWQLFTIGSDGGVAVGVIRAAGSCSQVHKNAQPTPSRESVAVGLQGWAPGAEG